MNEKEMIKKVITIVIEQTYAENFEELRYLFRRYEEADTREKCKAGELNV